ncbi:hypothetical protein CVT24_000159 [Panaeolus cyanescens]|uniref:ORC1/DEAH AAA+ ATPase domain-containing protein n=1 Tax=Panaeolus cyanescens TaxID=181874 RepID=A0A409VIT6_9AGAR|nr:hypothetical protein CVT24_000159 [Panaeolus cyanescens]
MGRVAVPTKPPSSGAVIFYDRARRNVKANRGSPPRTRVKSSAYSEVDSENSVTTSDSGKTLSLLSSDASSQSSSSTKVEESSDGNAKISTATSSKQAAMLALALVKDITEIFSEVPYVQVLVQAVRQVILISEQLTANKERSAELVEKISLYSKVVFDALLKLKKPFPELGQLKEDLEQLARVIDGIHKLLATMTASNKSIIRRVLGREEVAQKLEEYDRKLDTSITLFQLKSSIVLRTNAEQGITIPAIPKATESTPSRMTFTRRYSKPHIMIGRDGEISKLVSALVEHSKRPLCILGPGGIGKTSLALSVFHADAIVQQYQDNRHFISCESATSPDILLGEIAHALHISANRQHLLDDIQDQLRQHDCLLVLDNFETSWDPLDTRSEVEAIINSLCYCCGLIVTMRGSQKPSGSYFHEVLTLPTLHMAEAERLFSKISGKWDAYASKLIQAVDCLPLAVTLLANLASVDGETTASMWARWQEESTSMVESGHGRLSSLDASIKISLSSQNMQSDPGALPFLSFLCMLPDGMSPELLHLCETDFPEPLSVRKALSSLRRNAFVQQDNEDYLKVLNPIRLFTCAHHPPSSKARAFLHDYFIQMALKMPELRGPVLEKHRKEVGNINTILCDAVQHADQTSFDSVVDAIFSFCDYSYISGVGTVQPLLLAEKRLATSKIAETPKREPKAGKWKKALHVFSSFGSKSAQMDPLPPSTLNNQLHSNEPTTALRADLLGCAGQMYSRQFEFRKAIEVLKAAHLLHSQVGDQAGQAYDLLNIGLAMHRVDGGDEGSDGQMPKEAAFTKALRIHEAIGDLTGQAHAMLAIAYAYCNSTDFEDARNNFLKASEIFSALQDHAGLASALYGLGMIELAKSAFALAEEQFTKALSLYEKTGDQVSQSQVLASIATTWLLRSRFFKAFDYLSKAMKLREPTVDPDHLHLLGRVYIAQEKWTTAREILEKSLELHRTNGDWKGQLADHTYLARVELHAPLPRTSDNSHLSIERKSNPHTAAIKSIGSIQITDPHTWDPIAVQCEIYLRYGQLRPATWAAEDILANLAHIDSLLSVAHAHHLLGHIHLRNGDEDSALGEFQEALQLHVKCDNLQGQADDINSICEVLVRKAEFHEASLRIQEAIALHVKIGHLTGQGDDLYVQGCIYLAQGALEDAETCMRKALELHRTSGFVFGQGKDLATLSDILWQQGQASTASDLSSEENVPGASDATTEDAEQLLDQAMMLFSQCRARVEYRQCLKLRAERVGQPWVERVFRRGWDGHENDEVIGSDWPVTYDGDSD